MRSGVLNLLDGVSGGADHAVVERESKAALFGQMGVHDLRFRFVCLTKEGKQGMGLGGEIVDATNGEQILVLQVGKLLQIAQNGAGSLCLLLLQEGQYVGGVSRFFPKFGTIPRNSVVSLVLFHLWASL